VGSGRFRGSVRAEGVGGLGEGWGGGVVSVVFAGTGVDEHIGCGVAWAIPGFLFEPTGYAPILIEGDELAGSEAVGTVGLFT
jgi:hypothetical protein